MSKKSSDKSLICYLFRNCKKNLGEFVDIGMSNTPIGFVSGLISLIALGVYAILQTETGNDDDDSDSGGGGLMQPVI